MKVYYSKHQPTVLLAALLVVFVHAFVVQQVLGRPVDLDLPEPAKGGRGGGPKSGGSVGVVPDAVLEKWKGDAGARAEVDLKGRLQKVSDRNTVVFPKIGVVDLHDLVPVQTMAEDATCVRDGRMVECSTAPTVFTATKTTGNGKRDTVTILVAYSNSGSIDFVKAVSHAGNRRTVEYLQGIDDTNVLTDLDDGDIDPEWKSQWIYEDVPLPSIVRDGEADDGDNVDVRRTLEVQEGRTERGDSAPAPAPASSSSSSSAASVSSSFLGGGSLRGSIEQQIEKKLQQDGREGEPDDRRLQTEGPRIIELAVTAESSFCLSPRGGNGSFQNTENKIKEVVADVSSEYQQPNVNFVVRMTYIEIYCDPTIDPMKQLVELNMSGCGGGVGLLTGFRDYWVDQRQNVPRDLVQLFSGTGLERKTCPGGSGTCSVIGCAWVGTVGIDRCFVTSGGGLSCYYDTDCNNEGLTLNYGVNFVTYTSNLMAQSNLVTHEMGHVLGSNHDPTISANEQYIMYPTNGGNDRTFSDQSVNSFLNSVGTGYCVVPGTDPSLETRFITAPPSSAPSASPSSTPPTSSDPSFAPTASPSSGPSSTPSDSPNASPSFSPSGDPSESPTGVASSAPSDSSAPSSSPISSPSSAPSSSPSSTPSVSPTDAPSPAPSTAPSSSPSESPTDVASSEPSDSSAPSEYPTDVPSASPSTSPSTAPSVSPSISRSASPSDSPSLSPTDGPSSEASDSPSFSPTNSPTESPSVNLTGNPTRRPSGSPSATPSLSPTDRPSSEPSDSPTSSPSFGPTDFPSERPSSSPTVSPTPDPSDSPSGAPTGAPIEVPSSQPPSDAPTTCAERGFCTSNSECCSGTCQRFWFWRFCN